MDYAEAARLFAKCRYPDRGKPIANNTRVMRLDTGGVDGPHYAIRFHATNVVVFHPSGAISLDTGGWETMSTCDRMGYAYPVIHVWREHNEIFACTCGRWNHKTAVRVGHCAYMGADREWAEHGGRYEDRLEVWAEENRERARYRRESMRGAVLSTALTPRHRYGWHNVRAGHVRITNGVVFSGENPVAVIYPVTTADAGSRARPLTVVSQRALKRTKIGMELVERASEAGHVLDFADHATVVTESQNRTGALAC